MKENKDTLVGKVSVYPNPNNGALKVEFAERLQSTVITVLNMLGEEVNKYKVENSSSFDLAIEGENGVYFLKISSGSKNTNIKVVKM